MQLEPVVGCSKHTPPAASIIVIRLNVWNTKERSLFPKACPMRPVLRAACDSYIIGIQKAGTLLLTHVIHPS